MRKKPSLKFFTFLSTLLSFIAVLVRISIIDMFVVVGSFSFPWTSLVSKSHNIVTSVQQFVLLRKHQRFVHALSLQLELLMIKYFNM